MSRMRRVLAGGAWAVGAHVLNVANQLLTVPLFLRRWDAELYGDWLTLSAMVAYLSFADVGMQSYVLNRLTGHAVTGRWTELRRDFASALALYAALVLPVTLLFVLGAWSLPLGARLQSLGAGAAVVATLLVLQVSASVVMGLAGGLYRVLDRHDLAIAASFAVRALQLGAVLSVLLGGGGPRALAAAQLGCGVVVLGAVLLDTGRREPRLRPSLSGARWKVARSFLAPSLLFLAFAMSNGLVVQGMVLLVSFQLGAQAVVTFTTSRAVANVVRQVVSLWAFSTQNEMTRLDALGAKARLAFVHRVLAKASSTLSAAMVAVLALSGPELYAMWTQGRAAADTTLMRWLLAEQVLTTPAWCSAIVLAATNRHRQVAKVQLLNAALTVGTAALLVPALGLGAAGAAACLVGFFSYALLVPRFFQAEVGESVWTYHRRLTLPNLALALALVALGAAVFALLPEGLGRVAVLTGVVSVAAVLLFWRALLDAEERGFMRGALLRALRRRAPEAAAGGAG